MTGGRARGWLLWYARAGFMIVLVHVAPVFVRHGAFACSPRRAVAVETTGVPCANGVHPGHEPG